MKAVTYQGIKDVKGKEVPNAELKKKNEEFEPTDIITHRLPLDQAEHGYDIFDEKHDDCIKVVLKP